MSEPRKKKISTLFMLRDFVQPYKKQLAAAIAALIFTAAITLSVGQGLKMLIDRGFVEQSLEQLNTAIFFILLLALLMSAGTFIRFYLVSWRCLTMSSACTRATSRPIAAARSCRD